MRNEINYLLAPFMIFSSSMFGLSPTWTPQYKGIVTVSNSNIIVNLVFEILGNKHDLHTKLMKYVDKYDLLEEKNKKI